MSALGGGIRRRAGLAGIVPGVVRLGLVLAVVGVPAGCGDARRTVAGEPDELMVFAAASLRDVMLDLAEPFESRSGTALSFNFAGSNVLARQLEASPRAADVFLSADHLWTDHLAAAGLLLPGSKVRFLSNRLVVVASAASSLRLSTLDGLAAPEVRFVAIGHPEAVPAGRYARACLERVSIGGESLWERVEGRLAPAADVRAALALVEARDDTVGIVYATDARTAAGVRVLLEIPADLTPPIGYFAAVTRETRHPDAATDLVRFLDSEEARAVFQRHGFELPAVPSG